MTAGKRTKLEGHNFEQIPIRQTERRQWQAPKQVHVISCFERLREHFDFIFVFYKEYINIARARTQKLAA